MRMLKLFSHVTNNSKSSLSLGMRCFLLLILLLAMVVFVSRMVTYHQLTKEQENLLEQKHMYENQIEKANHYLNTSIDYDDIVAIAREKFHLAFPDDTIYYSGQGTQP